MYLDFYNYTRQKLDIAYFKKIEDLDFPYKSRLKNKTIEISFVGGVRIRKINKEFRKKDKATDVISLPFGEMGGDTLGEIVIFPKYKNFKKKEVAHLIIHGVLHILGYDHKTNKEAEKMEQKEKKLLSEFLSV